MNLLKLIPFKRILIGSAITTTVVMTLSKYMLKPNARKAKALFSKSFSKKEKDAIKNLVISIDKNVPDLLFIRKVQQMHYKAYVKRLNTEAKRIMNK